MNFLSTDPELESIEIGKFLDEDDFEVNEDSVERAVESLEKIWDSDVQPVMVELEIAGEDYTLFMLCVNYDGKWYNADFNNTIALSLGVGSTSKGLVPNEELPD